jgi:glycosyltransferase involved in cell wall biosynthesis
MTSILISANSSWNIINYRAGLIAKLIERGFQVEVAAPSDDFSHKISGLGARFHPVTLESSGLSPLRDAKLFIAYLRILRKLRPSAYLGFTAKPNIYGSMAAHVLGIKVVNNISGLGIVFTKAGPLRQLVEALYFLGLSRSDTVFFQNPDDLRLFRDRGLVTGDQARLLPGSGVDLEHFRPSPGPRASGPIRFLMVARMLWDKGVGEYVEAARILGENRSGPQLALLGPAGVDNPGAVPIAQIEKWVSEGLITYLGETDDVRMHLADADCVVLPSYYREGIPRSLIEAAAMGKPAITTDEVGCREAVEDGRTGFLCKARSASSLVGAMKMVMELDEQELVAMGSRARRKAEHEFDERLIFDAYIGALERQGSD